MKAPKIPMNGESILGIWNRSKQIPFGSQIFSRVLGWAIPYTSSVGSQVEILEAGHAVVRLADRRAVRNHLASVHAIALANIGEFSTGLALTTQMPKNMRAILGSLKIDYLKKARGRLKAEARCEVILPDSKSERVLVSEISDETGVCVARVEATWVVGPENKRKAGAA